MSSSAVRPGLGHLLTLSLALAAGCVATDDVPTPSRGPDRVDDPPLAFEVVGESPASDPASCSASLERSTLPDGSCVARVTVGFTCDVARPQTHGWARVGALCDGAACAYDDVEYRCGAALMRSFAIPCGTTELIGGATFDHPRTAADVSCMSAPLAP